MSELVLFHDADGCLNPTDGHPLSYTGDALTGSQQQRLRELGEIIDASPISHFVLNTGRSWEATTFLCDAMECQKLAFAVVEHGAELWDVPNRRAVDLDAIAKHSAIEGLREALASRHYVAELLDWYHQTGANELCERFDYSEPLDRTLDKSWNLTVSVPDELDSDAVFEHLQRLVEGHESLSQASFTYHHSRWNRFIDVMSTMDKGIGVALVMEHLGIDASLSAAVGDGLNDVSMLERVGTPVCPANAESRVVELCRTHGYASRRDYIDATIDWIAVTYRVPLADNH